MNKLSFRLSRFHAKLLLIADTAGYAKRQKVQAIEMLYLVMNQMHTQEWMYNYKMWFRPGNVTPFDLSMCWVKECNM